MLFGCLISCIVSLKKKFIWISCFELCKKDMTEYLKKKNFVSRNYKFLWIFVLTTSGIELQLPIYCCIMFFNFFLCGYALCPKNGTLDYGGLNFEENF